VVNFGRDEKIKLKIYVQYLSLSSLGYET